MFFLMVYTLKTPSVQRQDDNQPGQVSESSIVAALSWLKESIDWSVGRRDGLLSLVPDHDRTITALYYLYARFFKLNVSDRSSYSGS